MGFLVEKYAKVIKLDLKIRKVYEIWLKNHIYILKIGKRL
jgi:hypothetical protein